jgi:hypothetical protein
MVAAAAMEQFGNVSLLFKCKMCNAYLLYLCCHINWNTNTIVIEN